MVPQSPSPACTTPLQRRIVLVQLPIPQPGMEPAQGNVPLAAGYLKLFARQQGLEDDFEIEIFPPHLANTLGDQGLVAALRERQPWMVGFTCYLWNINRSLWIAERLKVDCPDVLTIFGGPEITADNDWVLRSAALDFACIGEGEQTFSELLTALKTASLPAADIHGLYVSPTVRRRLQPLANEPATAPPPLASLPLFRAPLPNLDTISSPYLAGILDAADEHMLLLETIRGCIFKCKFCYYPKSYDDLYFVSRDKIVANLRHAQERGATEVVLLDPTLNQRRDFAEFVRLLIQGNPDRQFSYFGELRAEGITGEIAGLLAEANFTEVEIGLQSIDPLAQELMDRRNNMKAFERGVRALRAAGIRVKIDLIIGLPGDTVASIRRGMQYLQDSDLYDLVQVFNLAILPGTAFRQEAEQLGLRFQPQPPYYVLSTPTLGTADFYQLMAEAQSIFETEFDPLPEPFIPDKNEFESQTDSTGGGFVHAWQIDFDSQQPSAQLPEPECRSQAFTLWFQGAAIRVHQSTMEEVIATCLRDNPHSTLQIILEPRAGTADLSTEFLDDLLQVCYRTTSYLDRIYSLSPGRRKGAKRLVLLLEWSQRDRLGPDWIESRSEYADIVWQSTAANADLIPEELTEFEYFSPLGHD